MEMHGREDSDLDLTCIIPGLSVEKALRIFEEKRQPLLTALDAAGVEVLQEIWTARVPVVKMKFAGFLQATGHSNRCRALDRWYVNMYSYI